MRTGTRGIAVIKEYEGVRLQAYKCPAGVWTIGVGHTSAAGDPQVQPGMTITEAEAMQILRQDLVRFEDAITRRVKVELKQHQFDALVSFVFNVGERAFAESTLLRKLNAGRYGDVPAELMKWTRGGGRELPGLVRRRRAEAALWRSVEDRGGVDVDEARAEPDAPPPAKRITQSREANAAVAVGTLSGVAVAADTVSQLSVVGDGARSLVDILMEPKVLVLLVIVLAAALIWNWRKQRLDETGE